MKKIIFGMCLLIAGACVFFVSCQKSTTEVPVIERPTTITCTDSAYLFADSLFASCVGQSIFRLHGRTTTFVSNTPITAIDTIVNGAKFYITYDSIPGTVNCGGATFTKANITCYQRY